MLDAELAECLVEVNKLFPDARIGEHEWELIGRRWKPLDQKCLLDAIREARMRNGRYNRPDITWITRTAAEASAEVEKQQNREQDAAHPLVRLARTQWSRSDARWSRAGDLEIVLRNYYGVWRKNVFLQRRQIEAETGTVNGRFEDKFRFITEKLKRECAQVLEEIGVDRQNARNCAAMIEVTPREEFDRGVSQWSEWFSKQAAGASEDAARRAWEEVMA